jgi:hypothetical protein
MLAFAAALLGFGYVKGLEHEKVAFDAFKASVEAAGEKQNEHTANVITQQKQISQGALNEANDLRSKLAKYYASRPTQRVCNSSASGSELPAVPTVAGESQTTSPEPRPSTDGTAPTVTVESCAQDALTVLLIQQWVEDQATIK